MVGVISSQTSVTGIEILFLIATVRKKRRGRGGGRGAQGERLIGLTTAIRP